MLIWSSLSLSRIVLTHNGTDSASMVRAYTAAVMGIPSKEDTMLHSAQKQHAETLSCTSLLSTSRGMSSDAFSSLRSQCTQKEELSSLFLPLYPPCLSSLACGCLLVGYSQNGIKLSVSQPACLTTTQDGNGGLMSHHPPPRLAPQQQWLLTL